MLGNCETRDARLQLPSYMMNLYDLKQYEAYGRALTENDCVRKE